ncbi:MAG TPA: multicopper oxidase domain-containing protein, partial [Candidatus Thermoplasmatota archaeon]|nr:multicopper oxidase domain-containing protein [Candidatus Thermoplasmatota archaeon]
MFDRRLVALTIAFVMGFTAIAQPTLGTPAETRAGNALPGTPCPVGSVARSYGVTSLPLPVSYNHWGDLDLQGMLFLPNENVDPVLSDVEAKLLAAGIDPLAGPVGDMRAALAAGDVGAAAQAAQDLVAAAQTMEQAAPPRSRVDQTDLVQPLILRAHVGECVTVRLTNILPAATSIHAHALVTPPGEGEATGVQKADFAMPGQTHDYTMYIPPWASMEGAHFLHSHVDAREQTRHGLFGAIVAEPLGSLWKSTADGVTDAPTGLEAMIVVPNAPDFREFVQIYHDEIELVDWQLDSLPEISPFGEYGPGTKGINLRTEPFMDRFLYHDELRADGKLARGHDKSQSYGSYTYGDPSTWIQKSYLGDPVKFRTINAGPGQYHIHHLHGGGIRWKSTPMAEPSQFAIGLTKGADNVQATQSQRLDVQNMGPGESFNLEPEGGSGGVQQSVGDFLYHCHIAEHYLAGMWSIWRTYNTIQPGLAELPDRAGAHQPAVNSAALLGHVFPDGSVLDASNIDAWVQSFLPPPGVPGEEDASVWDWKVSHTAAGPVYLGEKETAFVWPDYPVDAPGRLSAGTRPEIGFDINTAKPASPMLRPHLGARPPFAPEHSGAPFLTHSVTPQLPDGLCPSSARPIKYDVVAIQADMKYNKFDS